jgi:glucosamine kinase
MDGPRYVGIDGGGTRATAVVCDAGGRELARVDGGAGIIHVTAPAAGARALADLTAAALRAAGNDPATAGEPAAVLCCALAGAGRPPERQALRAALHELGAARHVRIVTDAEAAMFDALGDGPGILLIAGTGSIAWGRSPTGAVARIGGWGHVFGDEGSGFQIGRHALRAVAHAHDGRGPATALLRPVLDHAGAATPEELIHWAAAAAKGRIAALARLVVDAADRGDDAAIAILTAAAADLARHVDALHRRLAPWPDPPRLALAGGLLLPGRPLRPYLLAALRDAGSPCDILDTSIDAARGAAGMALATATDPG